MKLGTLVGIAIAASLTSVAAAQLTQKHTTTFTASGVPWPNFTCSFSCNGPTTTVNGIAALPKFSAEGTLTAVMLEFVANTGGSYAGQMSVPNPGFTGVTGSVVVNIMVTPPGSTALTGSNSLIHTVNANNQPFISIPLPPQVTGDGPDTLPPSRHAAFTGPGSINIPIKATFKQDVYPSNHSINGSFILGFSASVTVTYVYEPPDLGGASLGSAGLPSLAISGSLQPAPVGVLNLGLSNAAPLAPALLAIAGGPGLASPVAGGGVFHALPNPLFAPLSTDANGAFQASSPLPGGLPIGAQFVAQFVIGDAAAAGGFSVSNAIRLTTVP
jgi:hypothetical protein